MNFLKHKKLFIFISFVLIAFGIFMGFSRGFKFDIDFKGGTRIQLDIGEEYKESDIKDIVKNIIGEEPIIQTLSSSDYALSITTNTITEDMSNQVVEKLNERYQNIDGVTIRNVQASYGRELIDTTIIASSVAIILLFVYIVIRFKVLGVPAAISAIIALMHDVLMMIAVYGFLGLHINATFIAVVLTILGYSINDTIVIFDRIRENKRKNMKSSDFAEIINISITQNLKRTIYTSLTTVAAVIVLYVAAYINDQQVLKEFSLPLIIGVVSGTYSSIFIAPAFLYYINSLKKRFSSK